MAVCGPETSEDDVVNGEPRMSSTPSRRRETRLGFLGRIPGDVWVALGALALTHAVVQLAPATPVRVLVVLAVLLFVPGYAFTTAAFPATRRPRTAPADSTTASGPAGITVVERLALSFGLSVALLPLYGLVLQVTVENFAVEPLLGLLTVVVPILLVVGTIRRVRTPVARRYVVPLREWLSTVRSTVSAGRTRDTVVNVALVVAVIASMSTLTFALVAPQDGSHFTEVSLLAQQPSGDFAGSNYPTTFTEGEGQSLMLHVQNKEERAVVYTVVIQQQRVDTDGQVRQSVELDRFNRRVERNQEWYAEHELAPTMAGEDIRVTYLVYRDTVPAKPTLENAYRSLTLWVDVEQTGA